METLALKIHRFPAQTVAKLRLMPVGCDWLRARWQMLAQTNPTEWTDEQSMLAGVLVGGDPSVDPTAPGFADGQVAELESRRERVAESDDIARTLVEADMSDDIPNLPRLRRYQRSLHRQMNYDIDQFHVEHPDRWDDPNRKPEFIAQACIDREREQTWNFAEPAPDLHKTKPTPVPPVSPDPAADKTKPTSVASELAADETKPTGAGSNHELNETKPFEALGTLVGAFNRGANWVGSETPTAPTPLVERPRPVNPPRTTHERQQAARRLASLAKLVGV